MLLWFELTCWFRLCIRWFVRFDLFVLFSPCFKHLPHTLVWYSRIYIHILHTILYYTIYIHICICMYIYIDKCTSLVVFVLSWFVIRFQLQLRQIDSLSTLIWLSFWFPVSVSRFSSRHGIVPSTIYTMLLQWLGS